MEEGFLNFQRFWNREFRKVSEILSGIFQFSHLLTSATFSWILAYHGIFGSEGHVLGATELSNYETGQL